jgi:hypothetical protein
MDVRAEGMPTPEQVAAWHQQEFDARPYEDVVEPISLVTGDALVLQRRLAGLIRAHVHPAARAAAAAHYQALFRSGPYRHRGWSRTIRDVTAVPGGYAVTVLVDPVLDSLPLRRQVYVRPAVAEQYLVVGDQVQYQGSVRVPGVIPTVVID